MSKVMRTHAGITEWNGDFWCDSCGKRVRGITTVNGMDFCAKCYQETFGETEKDRKIADLEAKLAEKDEQLEYFSKRDDEQEKQLEKQAKIHYKQLAEKETDLSLARNEINTLKHNLNVSQEHDKVVCEQYFEKCKETEQDKISFCIEKLKKVKKLFEEKYTYDVEESDFEVIYEDDVDEIIDNQIEELKKEMK